MFSSLFTATLFASVAVHSALAALAVNSPELKQCQPATVNWEYTSGDKFTLLAVPAGSPCDDAIVDLGDHESGSFDWAKVNVAKGTQVILSVTNKAGEEVWSSPITVGDSDDASCLTGGSPAPAAAAATPAKSTTSSNTPKPVAGTTSGSTDSTDTSDPVDPDTPSVVGAVSNAKLLGSGVSARQASPVVAVVVGLVAAFALL